MAILLGLPLAMVSGLAFVGGLAAVAVVTLVARRIGEQDPVLVLVLAGVAVGALLGAGISLVKLLAGLVARTRSRAMEMVRPLGSA